MKKFRLPMAALAAASLIFASCNSDNDDDVTADLEQECQVTAPVRCMAVVAPFVMDDEMPTTRINVELTASGVAFKWAENDALGVFPAQTTDSQIKFLLDDGSGSQTASFDGGDWRLRDNSSYLAYYPYNDRGAVCTSQSLPVSYDGQAQQGNGSTAHLGAFDFVTSTATRVSNGSVLFNMRHHGSLVRLTLKSLAADNYKQMSIESDLVPFTIDGTCDLASGSMAIAPVRSSSHITMHLDGVSTAAASDFLVLYMMLPPADYKESHFTVVVKGEKDSYMTTFDGRAMEAGHAYAFAGNLAPYEYPSVDLGLSVDWATFNEGADFPEEGGRYYSWGETTEKPVYSWAAYSHCQAAYDMIIKYGSTDWYAPVGFKPDKQKVLLPEDDAPARFRGGDWRSPSRAEIEELINECSWTWTTMNDVNGYRVTGKNGASIFLPAAGHRTSGETANGYGEIGLYMSGEMGTADYVVRSIYFSRNLIKSADIERYEGNVIRPVKKH